MNTQKANSAAASAGAVSPLFKIRMRNHRQKLRSITRKTGKGSLVPDSNLQHSTSGEGSPEEKSAQKSLSEKILRFRKSERVLHWAIAIPFLVCYMTALVLILYYNGNGIRPYREVFSIIHRISGVCLIVLPLLVVIVYRKEYKIYLDNLKEAWMWKFHDVKWLVLSGPAAISKKVQLPDQDKYNAAEKINFMTLTATYPLYIVTGLFIWLSNGSLLSWFIHIGMALYATPLLIGHKFMAAVNPSTRVGLPGMFSGYVDREWARHHYTKWYWKHFGSDHDAPVENAGDDISSAEEDAPCIAEVKKAQDESLQPVRVLQETC